MFNSFSDEQLKAELERRKSLAEPDLDFDDGLDIEVENLELKLLSDDDLDDFDELDFDDDDLDFDDDDEETELKKDELSD
ncbi:DNA-directed RNA polymerase subunit delta, partial [Vibrio parahaemolyticus]|nr:DNA-directed RNA polymerase subunit delta [Vibrio parahaemolyticus]